MIFQSHIQLLLAVFFCFQQTKEQANFFLYETFPQLFSELIRGITSYGHMDQINVFYTSFYNFDKFADGRTNHLIYRHF